MFTGHVTIKLKDVLWEIKAPTGNWFPRSKFLIMFMGVVVGPLVILTLGGLGLGLLPIALLLLLSISGDSWLYRHKSDAEKDLSISQKYC